MWWSRISVVFVLAALLLGASTAVAGGVAHEHKKIAAKLGLQILNPETTGQVLQVKVLEPQKLTRFGWGSLEVGTTAEITLLPKRKFSMTVGKTTKAFVVKADGTIEQEP